MNDIIAKLLLDKEDIRFQSLEEKNRKIGGGRRDIFDDTNLDDSDKFNGDAMSQYQDKDKSQHRRSSNYGDLNQWDYLNQQEISNATNHSRRGHFPFGSSSQAHSVGWNSLGMSLPRQTNPYFTNTLGPVMPAHAHSVGRYNQWNNPSQKNLPNLNNAHSQSRVEAKHRSSLSNSVSGYILPSPHPSDFPNIRNNPRDLLRTQLSEKAARSNMRSDHHHSSSLPAIRNPTGRPSLSVPSKTVISNPLSDLQMLVKNQENDKKSQKSDFYQQESVDLSAHSDSTKQVQNPLKREDKFSNENTSDSKEHRPSDSVKQTQNDQVNRVDEKGKDGIVDVKRDDLENISDTPVELTSKSSEKNIKTTVTSSFSIGNTKLEKELTVVPNENSVKSEQIDTKLPVNNVNANIVESVTTLESEKTNVSNVKSEVSSKQKTSSVNSPAKTDKRDTLMSETLKEGNELIEEPEKENFIVEKVTEKTEVANGEPLTPNNKRKAENLDNLNTESKRSHLDVESRSENNAMVTAEESLDMPTVSSTSFSSETSKKTPKKKPNRKSRTFRLSSGQSSSSESQFYNKKFRTLNKDENRNKKKKGLCDSGDRRGPILHVEGSKESPTSVTVINFPKGDDEDERDKSAVKKQTLNLSRTKHHNELDYRGKSKNSLFSSTLSSRYDAHTTDYSWICVFCKKGPHYNTLGDLFGPYIISKQEISNENYYDFSGDEKDISDAQKRGGRNKKSIRANNLVEHFQKMSKKLRRIQSNESSLIGMTLIAHDESEQERYEVWVHEQCAIWSPNVYLIGTRIMGMQEAIWSSVRTTCSKCGISGANIGCVFRNCPNRSHYHCAKENEWSLEQETFISTCQVHKPRS